MSDLSKAELAALAGARGRSIEPLSHVMRQTIYYWQGRGPGGLTPKQARRLRKKRRHALAGAQ